MDTPKQTYPTGLTLPDGTVLNVQESPELKKFFDATCAANSHIEKGKLYLTIEQQKARAEAAEKEISTLTTQLQEAMTMYAASAEDRTRLENENRIRQQELEDSRKNLAEYTRQKAEIDTFNKQNPITKENLAAALGDLFATGIPKEIADVLQGPVQGRLQKLEANAVTQYRADKLIELDGKVMPELVKGDTIEEIDASIPFAMEMYAKYGAGASAQNGNTNTGSPSTPPANAGGQTATPPVVAPVTNVTNATPPPTSLPKVGLFENPETASLPDFKTMSNEEFAANRPAYMEALRRYEQQMGARK